MPRPTDVLPLTPQETGECALDEGVTGSLFALLVLSILSTMVAVPPIMFAEWLFEHYIAPPTNWGHKGGRQKRTRSIRRRMMA
jgi:hypothetical protein